MATLDFNTAYPKLYAGWDKAAAQADFNATGGKNKAGYSDLVGGASSPSAASSFQMPDFESILNKQNADRVAKEQQSKAQEDDFLTRFRNAISGQESLTGMADRLGSELGLGDLRTNAQSLTSAVKAIPTVQTQATRGYDVNANQLSRIINQKTSELAPTAQTAVEQQQNAEKLLSEKLGYGLADQQKSLTPFTTEGALMSDRIAREMTGFNQGQTNELNSIIAKMQSGATLAAAEITRANDLAKLEKQYELEKQKLITVGDGSSVYDPVTGTFKSNGGGSTGNAGSYLTTLKSTPSTPTTSSTGSGISNLWGGTSSLGSADTKANLYNSIYGGSSVGSALNALR